MAEAGQIPRLLDLALELSGDRVVFVLDEHTAEAPSQCAEPPPPVRCSSDFNVHGITRDPTNDYGMDWLRLHLQESSR